MQDFKNKAVAITGGATGIGFALARALGAEGARIVIGEPRSEQLKKAATVLEAEGITVHTRVLDVCEPASIEAFAGFIRETWGGSDLLINNAGVASARRLPVHRTDMEDVRALFDVNFFGVWQGCAIFGRQMMERGTPAAIYNVSSENALFTAVPHSAAYIASKHAVLGLSEALRAEVPDFIHVGTIFPGFVRSDMTRKAGAAPMDADRFAAIVLKQIRAGERFIVSHAYNQVHLAARHAALEKAFATYAPRYEGDDEFDVPSFIRRITQ